MSVVQNLAEIRDAMAAACRRSGRDPSEANLLAVSKLQPVALIEEAYASGLRDFGENYVQELLEKKEALRHLKGIRWHLIGHLQTNKVKQAVQCADCFHAVDSEKLVLEAVRRLGESQRTEPWPVFVEVNLDQEASKAGICPDDALRLVERIRKEPRLHFAGLMCIPEPQALAESMRPAFRRLAQLGKNIGAPQLSMGMSEDFEIAIEEGANWVRVGRKLFGERQRSR